MGWSANIKIQLSTTGLTVDYPDMEIHFHVCRKANSLLMKLAGSSIPKMLTCKKDISIKHTWVSLSLVTGNLARNNGY